MIVQRIKWRVASAISYAALRFDSHASDSPVRFATTAVSFSMPNAKPAIDNMRYARDAGCWNAIDYSGSADCDKRKSTSQTRSRLLINFSGATRKNAVMASISRQPLRA